VGGLIYLIYSTWIRGRRLMVEEQSADYRSLKEFVEAFRRTDYKTVDGTAVWLTGNILTTPPAFLHNLKHNKVIHKKVVFLSVGIKNVPRWDSSDRFTFEDMGNNFYRLIVKYGYLDSVNIEWLFSHEEFLPFEQIDAEDLTFFIGRETVFPSRRTGMPIWQDYVFLFLVNNSQRATRYFNLPRDKAFEVGEQLKV
ncbi:MAG: KUP/HAK/KT family potassium transporter, partial [Saprospiraceae bacterium]|nr:KUP/HAK/KT family potassium transporter [Saprospiraceae bacterium]